VEKAGTGVKSRGSPKDRPAGKSVGGRGVQGAGVQHGAGASLQGISTVRKCMVFVPCLYNYKVRLELCGRSHLPRVGCPCQQQWWKAKEAQLRGGSLE